MPKHNMTLLQAANEVFQVVYGAENKETTAPTPSGTWPQRVWSSSTLVGRIFDFIDNIATRDVLEAGSSFNVIHSLAVTSNGSGNIELPENVLAIVQGKAQLEGRRLDIRYSGAGGIPRVIDVVAGSEVFAPNTIYHLEVRTNHAFEDLTFNVQRQIVRYAQQNFNMTRNKDQVLGQFIAQEQDRATAQSRPAISAPMRDPSAPPVLRTSAPQ